MIFLNDNLNNKDANSEPSDVFPKEANSAANSPVDGSNSQQNLNNTINDNETIEAKIIKTELDIQDSFVQVESNIKNPKNTADEPRLIHKDVVEKKNTSYRYTKMSNFVLKLSRFYALMPMWKLALITGFLAIIFGIVGVFLVKNPGIYNFGLAAFGQAISRLTNVLLRNNPKITPEIYNIIDHSLFWLLYLILSIPIFIFGWKKVGKVFTILTLEFLVVSSIVSFALGQIPVINKIYIIGDFGHSEIPDALRKGVQDKLWAGKGQMWTLVPLVWSDGGNVIAQTIFAVVYGVLLAFFFAIIAIIGGSAGVTGIIGEYMSTVKQKNFGTINGYINLIILIASVLVGSYLPGSLLLNDIKEFNIDTFLKDLNLKYLKESNITDLKDLKVSNITELYQIGYQIGKIREAYELLKSQAWQPSMYFSPNFVATFICNFVFVIYLNKLFPRFKVVHFKVYSHHMSLIRKAIADDSRTVTNFTITVGESGRTGSKTKILSSITLYKQVPRLIKRIRKVDQKALITISNVSAVDGNIYIPESKF